MHQTGDKVSILGVLIVFHSLDEGRGAIADADNPNPYFIPHVRLSALWLLLLKISKRLDT